MRSVNKVILVGRVAADPEVRKTPKGEALASFPIAVNRDTSSLTGEPKKAVDFHRIICFRKLADVAAQYFLKGTGLYIEGRLQNRSYEKPDGTKHYMTEIVAETINVLVWKKREDGTHEVSVAEPDEEMKDVIGA